MERSGARARVRKRWTKERGKFSLTETNENVYTCYKRGYRRVTRLSHATTVRRAFRVVLFFAGTRMVEGESRGPKRIIKKLSCQIRSHKSTLLRWGSSLQRSKCAVIPRELSSNRSFSSGFVFFLFLHFFFYFFSVSSPLWLPWVFGSGTICILASREQGDHPSARKQWAVRASRKLTYNWMNAWSQDGYWQVVAASPWRGREIAFFRFYSPPVYAPETARSFIFLTFFHSSSVAYKASICCEGRAVSRKAFQTEIWMTDGWYFPEWHSEVGTCDDLWSC